MAVLGLARLQRKLKALPAAARADISKAMEAGANRMVALAKTLVARDSGDLANSIGWTWGDAPDGAMVLGQVKGVRGSGNLRITIYAGNDEAFYARWVEFGTSPHANEGLFAGSEHPGTDAQPFFYPSWRAVRRTVKGGVSRAINKSAKRIAAGG